MTEIKSNKLTRFQTESGADTHERNHFLSQWFSHARQHIHRTIVLHITQTKKLFHGIAPQGGGGSLQTKKGEKSPFYPLLG